jgi:hypothetical protein
VQGNTSFLKQVEAPVAELAVVFNKEMKIGMKILLPDVTKQSPKKKAEF